MCIYFVDNWIELNCVFAYFYIAMFLFFAVQHIGSLGYVKCYTNKVLIDWLIVLYVKDHLPLAQVGWSATVRLSKSRRSCTWWLLTTDQVERLWVFTKCSAFYLSLLCLWYLLSPKNILSANIKYFYFVCNRVRPSQSLSNRVFAKQQTRWTGDSA